MVYLHNMRPCRGPSERNKVYTMLSEMRTVVDAMTLGGPESETWLIGVHKG